MLKISQKIFLGFLLVFALISLSGVPTSLNFGKILDAFAKVTDYDLGTLNLTQELFKFVLEADTQALRWQSTGKEDHREEFHEKLRRWQNHFSHLKRRVEGKDDKFGEIESATEEWFAEVQSAIKDPTRRTAIPSPDKLRPLYNDLISDHTFGLFRSYENSVRLIEKSGDLAWTLRAMALLVGLVTCLIVIRSVKMPLNRLIHATESIGAGKFESIPTGSRDELGQLTSAFNSMSQSLKERTEALEEQRRLAVQASRLKTEFLANTSHELRTPLNTIIGYAQLVQEGLARSPEEQAKYMKTIQQSSKHLLALINDVLDIARIEAGQMKFDLEPVSLKAVLHDVEKHLRLPAREKGLLLDVAISKGVDLVKAHPGRLSQVLLNTLGNAVKFTKDGSVTARAVLLEPDQVKITIKDTGIGIPKDKQDRLFQKFVQVDGSMTRSFGGTGLGLALSKTLLEMMNGRIELFSEGEGSGTTVTIILQREIIPSKSGSSASLANTSVV
jgi:signal transduction histidine kinase